MSCAFEPVTIASTGNQTGVSTSGAGVMRCDNASLLTIHGIAAGYSGQQLTIVSVGAGQVDIANQSGTESVAANRIINGVTGTISLAAGVGRAILEYDATTARWRVVEHEQGAYISPAFNAANFTASGSMTWTVESGDVTTYAYYLKGRQLTIDVLLVTTTVGGTPSNNLIVAIPGGFTAAKGQRNVTRITDNGTAQVGLFFSTAATTTIIVLSAMAATNWTASTNNTQVNGQITIEVQ